MDNVEETIISVRREHEAHFAATRAKRERNQRYRSRLRDRCIELLGGRCRRCRSTQHVEFAHIKETPLRGRGRGLDRRYRDILKHPDCYVPMCHGCHRAFTLAGDYRAIYGLLLEAWLKKWRRGLKNGNL